uniref:Ovule protein n=1 Tax=Parascaris univalens TaxID=6257 RepID=A0A915BV54_PARUN
MDNRMGILINLYKTLILIDTLLYHPYLPSDQCCHVIFVAAQFCTLASLNSRDRLSPSLISYHYQLHVFV